MSEDDTMYPYRDRDREEIEITAITPIGKLAARGLKLSDTIALITLLGTLAMLFGIFTVYDAVAKHQDSASNTAKQFVLSLRETSFAQRMQTCILAMPQEKRESEYMNPNSFCRQMAAVQ